jgi:hypothetical protein
METRVHDLEAVNIDPPERIIPRDLQKLKHSLKLQKACGIYSIQN